MFPVRLLLALFYTQGMTMQFLFALMSFVVVLFVSLLFQLIIILDFRSTLLKRREFYRAIGSIESLGTWKTLSLLYLLATLILSVVTGILLYVQPHFF